jgi:hypothetical protein
LRAALRFAAHSASLRFSVPNSVWNQHGLFLFNYLSQ